MSWRPSRREPERGRLVETPHYRAYPAVLIRLEKIDRAELAERIEDAWLAQAPKRLVAEHMSAGL